METVFPLVFCELIVLAVELKAGTGNAICMPPDNAAETARISLVNRGIVVAQYHIDRFSVSCGQLHADPSRAEIRKARASTCLIAELIELCLPALREGTETSLFHCHFLTSAVRMPGPRALRFQFSILLF